MSSNAITTLVKMMESLPEPVREEVVEHLKEHIRDLEDELKWNRQFEKTQTELVAAARKAREEIAEGHARPMDYDKL